MRSRSAGPRIVTLCALTALTLGSAFARRGPQVSNSAALHQVVVRNLPQPGAFEVKNTGPDVELDSDVGVQRQTGSGWAKEGTEMTLQDSCRRKVERSVHLLHGSEIQPVRWNGHTCGSQCPTGCRANIYLGPGKFRFVVSTAEGAEHFVGDAFEMPADKR